jgi:citrate lyase synthetase
LFREWSKADFPKPIYGFSFGKIAPLIPETTVHYFCRNMKGAVYHVVIQQNQLEK